MTDVGTTPRGYLSKRTKLAIFEREKGLCMLCGIRLQTGRFIYEHVRALELGGADEPENIRLTCLPCAGEKTKRDHSRAAKAKSQKQAHLGMKSDRRKPLPFGRDSNLKIRMDGTVVDRRTGEPIRRTT